MRVLEAEFESGAAVLEAVRAARQAGHDVLEVWGPHAVPGLDRALGFGVSRLPWACLGGAAAGAAGMLLLQYATAVVDWPLDVGGMPRAAWPAFLPIVFETAVLFGAFAVVLAFLLGGGGRGRGRRAPPARCTDDRFVLVARPGPDAGGGEALAALLAARGACRVGEGRP